MKKDSKKSTENNVLSGMDGFFEELGGWFLDLIGQLFNL